MNWRSAAKRMWPSLKPCRPNQFVCYDGKIIVAGHEQPVALVFDGKDLETLAYHLRCVRAKSSTSEAGKMIVASLLG